MKFSIFNFRNRRGQLIVEAIMASSILLTGFLGILALLSRSLSLNRVVTDNYTASYLASEGIEVVKNILDHNVIIGAPSWSDGLSSGDFEVDYLSRTPTPFSEPGRPISFDSTTGLYSYSAPEPTNFTRKIRLTLIGSNELRVKSIVTWSTGLARSSVNLEDRFFNWRP